MKTFTTSGTGNQQTLSPIETDKIPVYDSVTDAEADLANLAENQIIATHDTGSELSAPVDTVQSGNMHAVTGNAVAEALTYSETETDTGKTWIDGKKIYRKCYTNLGVEITNPNNWYVVMAYPTFIDTITDYITMADKRAFQNSLIYKLSNDLSIISSQSWKLDTLILEYTKV